MHQRSAAPAGAWKPLALLAGCIFWIAAYVLTWRTPCDPTAPIMSFDGSRSMPSPYGGIVTILGTVGWLLLTTAVVALPTGQRPLLRTGLAIVTFFGLGFVGEGIEVWIWQGVCPP